MSEKGNKCKAEAFLREKLTEAERMEGIVKTDTSFSDYVRLWLEQIARTVDETTLQSYRIAADGHVLAYFDHLKHDLPHIRFHELRHSCASMLIAMGWTLKDVQEWLGHADIQMTANIYSHLDIARKNNIAASLSTQFGL